MCVYIYIYIYIYMHTSTYTYMIIIRVVLVPRALVHEMPREFHEPGLWYFSAQFWRRSVVSANLRSTCWSFCREMTVSPILRKTSARSRAAKRQDPGSQNS